MKNKLLSAVIAGFMAATPVMAELTFSSLSYRTGAYGNNGIPSADGFIDYFTLLQERDGGIGGDQAFKLVTGNHVRNFRNLRIFKVRGDFNHQWHALLMRVSQF